MTITRRPETPDDEPFLRQMIIASVAQELMAWTWPEAVRDHLLGVQYTAKLGSLRASYPQACSEIILVDSQPAGWIFLDETPEQVYLAEIMISIEMRGQGVGAAVLREVLARADRARKPVRLSVNVMNTRAIQLYERLGFARTGGSEVQHEMERPANPGASLARMAPARPPS
jgi:ribosomal protein S18 acetylase RimI-like enzyme